MQNYNQGLKLITCGVNGQQILICSYFCNGVNACSTIDIWNMFEIVTIFEVGPQQPEILQCCVPNRYIRGP